MSSGAVPTTTSRAGTCSTSASKARSRTGRPLRSSARPTNSSRSSSPPAPSTGSLRREADVDAVGDDLVVAAVPAAAGPLGGLGDGDPGAELVELAAGAEPDRDLLGQELRRVGVEGADDGRAAEAAGVPAEDRRGRLLDVDDVEAAVAKLAAQLAIASGKTDEVRDRAVGAEADRAAERRQVVGHRPDARSGSAVERTAEAVRRVPGREDPDFVSPPDQMLGERLGMPVDAPLIRPRIRRDEGDSHLVRIEVSCCPGRSPAARLPQASPQKAAT